jgi:hypothetical protein
VHAGLRLPVQGLFQRFKVIEGDQDRSAGLPCLVMVTRSWVLTALSIDSLSLTFTSVRLLKRSLRFRIQIVLPSARR